MIAALFVLIEQNTTNPALLGQLLDLLDCILLSDSNLEAALGMSLVQKMLALLVHPADGMKSRTLIVLSNAARSGTLSSLSLFFFSLSLIWWSVSIPCDFMSFILSPIIFSSPCLPHTNVCLFGSDACVRQLLAQPAVDALVALLRWDDPAVVGNACAVVRVCCRLGAFDLFRSLVSFWPLHLRSVYWRLRVQTRVSSSTPVSTSMLLQWFFRFCSFSEVLMCTCVRAEQRRAAACLAPRQSHTC